MAGTDLLERPPEAPVQTRPGPSLGDGNPMSNARGQFQTGARTLTRPPIPTSEELARELAQYEAEEAAAVAEAEAADALAASAAAGETAAAPEEAAVPVWGWIVGGVAVLTVGGLLLRAHQLDKAAAKKKKEVEDLKKKLAQQAASGGGNGNGNVKITGNDPCDLQPYNKNKCPDEYEAHHVIADMVLRYGVRGSATRIPNAPSLNEGLTICLSQSEHDQVHAIMDKAIRALGRGSATGEGTAPMNQIVDEAIKAVEEVKPECKGKFEAVRKQFEQMGDQPGRTTHNPPKPGSPAEGTLKSGGNDNGTR